MSNTKNMPGIPINYVEFKARDLNAIKAFYTSAFNWNFTDYGPTYTSFSNSGIEGGFELTDQPITNGALVVLRSDNLEEIRDKVLACGGKILVPIFSFPGGRRFQFEDPSGNELSVWTEVGESVE